MVLVDSTTMAMTASDPGVGLTVEWRAQSVASNQDHQSRRRLGVAHRHAGSRVNIACVLRTVLRVPGLIHLAGVEADREIYRNVSAR